ncbi:MAG: tetratricopeptide repeat protein [Chthoniobacter sp.]|nr:tetratricopeptide repeat protein [Chthoniobacter sp.]
MPAARPRLSETRLATYVALALAAAVLCAYALVVRCDFVAFDDNSHVYENPLVLRGLSWAGVRDAFHFHASLWIPLTWISFMADVSLFGLHPGAMHAVNLAFHAASTVVLFSLLHRATGHLWASAFVAALFGLHPINVESVAWVAERKNVLSTFFCLAALLAYVRYAERWRATFYLAAVLCAALSLLAKPMAVTLPFALLLLDHWPLNRWGHVPWRRLLVEKIPFVLLAAGACWMAMHAPQERGALVTTATLPLAARVSNALISYVAYLGTMLWPGGLAVYYPHPIDPQPLLAAAAAALLLAISALAVIWWKKHPYLLAGWCWYLGVLVPVLGLVQVGSQARADRFTYLPQLGLFCALTWLVAELWPAAHRKALATGAVLALTACALLTARNIAPWMDSLALFEHTARVTRGNACAHTNAGLARSRRGDYPAAIAHFQASLRITPDQPAIWNEFGASLTHIGKQADANACFRTALQLDATDLTARYNLATGLCKTGATDEAIAEFRQILHVLPDFARAHFHLGLSLQTQGRTDEARKHLREAARLAPTDQEIIAALRVAEAPPQNTTVIRNPA